MNAKAIIVVLFAALGVVGWFLLGGGAEVEPSVAPAGGTASAGPVAKANPEIQGVARPANAPVDLDRTAAPAADPGKGPGGGSVSVRGRIVDGKGAPRAGVELGLRSWSRRDGAEGIDLADLPLPGPAGNQRLSQPVGTTRADGTFQFPLPADRDARLELVSNELIFASAVPMIQGGKGDQNLGDLVAAKGGSLQGLVQDEHGRPVPDVKVAASVGDLGFVGFGATSSAKTGADGTFTVDMLKPGKWTLRTASGKFLPAVQEFTLALEEQRTDIVVVVRPGQAIAGQVIDERSVPVAGCKVGSKRKESRGGVAIERFASDESTTTDAHGFFTLSGLSTETATVRAFGAGHTPATAADVPVGTGNLVLRVERLGSVEGVLLGADGAPIAGSRVAARANGDGPGGPGHLLEDGVDDMPMGPERQVATTAADGTFRIEGVRPGLVTVVASGKSHRPVRQRDVQVLPAQSVRGLRLLADVGATARVKVVDEEGKPVAGAKVLAERPKDDVPQGDGPRFASRRVEVSDDNGDVRIGGGPEAFGSATTDAEGVALVTGLPAGQAQLSATHAEYAPANAARVTLPKSGTVDASLTVRKPGFADVTVTGADGAVVSGAGFRFRGPMGAGQSDQSGKTDESGLAHIGPLAAGTYTAMLTRPQGATNVGDMMFVSFDADDGIESSQQQFTVVAGQTARVELRKPVLTRIHGTVTGVDGPVAACSIELNKRGEASGDLPGMGGGRTTKTAADGSFEIDDVESGSYSVSYGKTGQIVKSIADVDVPPNQAELLQDLVVRTGKLRVQACTQGAGEAIRGAEVEITRARAGASEGPRRQQRMVMMVSMNTSGADSGTTTMTMGSQRAQTDEDGWAEIEDVPVGEYDVRVTHKKYAPAEKKGQAVVERRTTECGRVEMASAGRIRGRVVGSDGKSATMALVQNRAVGSSAWSEPTMAMGGSFKIEGLAAGKYALRAQMIGETPGAFGPEIEVDVKGGEIATAEVRLPEK